MRKVLGEALPKRASKLGPEIWVIHIIIGDAIPTNDSASRVVWASVKERDLKVRYFLLVSKCMNATIRIEATRTPQLPSPLIDE